MEQVEQEDVRLAESIECESNIATIHMKTSDSLDESRHHQKISSRSMDETSPVFVIPTKAYALNGEHDGFQGGPLGTDAQPTVAGMKQATAYCNEVGIDFNPAPSRTLFSFGKGRSTSLGRIPFIISTPQNLFKIWVDVIQ